VNEHVTQTTVQASKQKGAPFTASLSNPTYFFRDNQQQERGMKVAVMETCEQSVIHYGVKKKGKGASGWNRREVIVLLVGQRARLVLGWSSYLCPSVRVLFRVRFRLAWRVRFVVPLSESRMFFEAR
jgi:hypothetical protein